MMKVHFFFSVVIFSMALLGCGDPEPQNKVATFESELLRESEAQLAPKMEEIESRVAILPRELATGQPIAVTHRAVVPPVCRAYFDEVLRCVEKNNNPLLKETLNRQAATLFESSFSKNTNAINAICRQALDAFEKNLAQLGCAPDAPAAPQASAQP